MKFLKENSVNLLITLFELVIGILLLINPVGFTTGIIIAAGAVLLVIGIADIVFYWRKPFTEATHQKYLAKGLTLTAAGLFCICFSRWFIETFPLLTFLYGLLLLVFGFYKVQWSVDLLRQKNKRWWMGALSAAASLIFSAVIIANPFASSVAIWYFVAIALIVEAVADLVVVLMIRIFINITFKAVKKEVSKNMEAVDAAPEPSDEAIPPSE